MKKKSIILILFATLLLSGCGNQTTREFKPSETEYLAETATLQTESLSTEPTEGSTETTQETESVNLTQLTSEELLDLFVDGEIMAYYDEEAGQDRKPFYITDLPLNVTDDWFSYSIGNRVDLDNDGEDELILEGPYGGMYFDAREGQMFVLAEGDGTAATLSYTTFEGCTWIVHSDVTHGGRNTYDFTLYDGEGQIVDYFRLMKEYWETPQEPDGPGTVYTYRGEQISKEEYDVLMEKFFPKSYFFPQGTEGVTYTGSLWDSSEQQVLELSIAKVEAFAEGNLYQLQIKYDKELQGRWGIDRRDLGLFLVMGDRIYKVDATKEAPYTVEDIISTGTLVCSKENKEDTLGEEEKGGHEYIVADGNRVEYHGYNTLVETGYYECFIWEKGKGLVEYRSGYGAGAEVELYFVG